MLLTPPQLPRPKAGDPVTAQGWNGLITGIADFYDAFATLGHDFVTVKVTYRQGPVDGVRVAIARLGADGKPVGPPLPGASVGGAGTEFRVPAVAVGSWVVYVEAPGFQRAHASVSITLDTKSMPAVEVELTATQLFVPDVAGFPIFPAEVCMMWSGFGIGVFLGPDRTNGYSDPSATVVLQSIPGGTPVPVADNRTFADPPVSVTMMWGPAPRGSTPEFGVHPATLTVVPDLIASNESVLSNLSSWGLTYTTTGPLGSSGRRVIDQDPHGGEIVPIGTVIATTLADETSPGAPLRMFAGTHAGLAESTTQPVINAARDQPSQPLGPVLGLGPALIPPWSFARNALSDAEIQAVRDVFTQLKVDITDDAGHGLAQAWESLRVAAILNIPGG